MAKILSKEEVQELIDDLAQYLAERPTPRFLKGGKATFSVSFDGGKTMHEIGEACIGDIRIDHVPKPPRPQNGL